MTTEHASLFSTRYLKRDLTAGLVVFLVALPLCLGIALASQAPLFAGLVAGIVGGIVVGSLSGSQTMVSGPAAALTTIVASQIVILGSFEAFLMAVVIGGVIQIGLGLARTGALSAFFPSSVIKGLLAAIGVILILKQIPHVLGHDLDPEGEMAFQQPDKKTTFSEIGEVIAGKIHGGAAIVGLISIAVFLLWERMQSLKKLLPAALIVVLLGVLLQVVFQRLGESWAIGTRHLVEIPVANNGTELLGFLRSPDFSALLNPDVYTAGVTIAIAASLASLLNLEAVDKIDPEKRRSPPSRELVAQGVGNICSGLLGGLPMTAEVVRGTVNVNAGQKTKRATIFHGILLLVCIAFFPIYLNMIPLASLGAILLVTGFKLASPKLFKQMWQEGRYQFLPFIITLVAIVLTDLLIGILIGLGISLLFILNSNLRRPIRRVIETHLGGEIMHIELANQVSFLNGAALTQVLDQASEGSHIMIDATDSDYIDPDILSLIREFKESTGPARGVQVSLRGFRKKYDMQDDIHYADYSTRELQDRLTPGQVLEILREGNRRFYSGDRLSRDFSRQIDATADSQHPLAVVLSCIDSRAPAELIFDLGLGDIFSVRVAGNVIGTKSLASIEYGVAVAGVKLVVVVGHKRCGAVTSAVQLIADNKDTQQETGCPHLQAIVDEIAHSVSSDKCRSIKNMGTQAKEALIDEVARQNVLRTVNQIIERSRAIRDAIDSGQIMVVSALYDITTGEIEFNLEGSPSKERVVSHQS